MEKGISKLANKRMFTMKIVDSDQFLNMSIEAQCAYFQLCMRSDDDGYLRSWKRKIRIIDAKEEAVSELISNEYLEKKSENVYKLPLFKETTGYGERDKQRLTKEYKKWRKEVLKRDNYICQMCGKPNSNIAHHKVRFRDCYEDKNIVYDIGNGVCLCKRCHKIAHGGGNYING